MKQDYDFIIVGAGSAGCVLANRLSADPDSRVLIVEAGPRDWNPIFRVPIMAGRMFRERYCNWNYETEPEPHLDNRRIPWPRGRVLGGSSSINGMVYARGNRQDYDGWAQSGLRSWSYDRVLPYFRKSERSWRGDDEFHGGDGLLPVGPARSPNPLYDAWIEAGKQAGHRENPDFNGEDQEGVGRYDYNIWKGQRWSSARSFLDPARSRPNLTVLTGAQLLKIVIEGGRAAGVTVKVGGKTRTLRAAREVVLSSGAIGSPAALLHSGIGDPDRLRDVGVPVTVELKGVGRNLHDHPHAQIFYASQTPDETFDHCRVDKAVLGFANAALFGKGPFARFPHEGGAFLKTDPAVASPDVQIHFFAGGAGRLRAPFARKGSGIGEGYGFSASVCQLRPESRGELTLRSADPLDAPVLRANYLSTETDRRTMREGLKMMCDILGQPAFEGVRGAALMPTPDLGSDADIDRWLAANISTIFHPVGTCRMGVDEEAVVDEELRVRGVKGLRVADASVMPQIVSANTHAATVMIAERAADLILAG